MQGPNNSKWTKHAIYGRSTRPRQDPGAGDKACHAQRNPAVVIFMEDEPSHQCGRRSLQRQQQRGSRGVGAR